MDTFAAGVGLLLLLAFYTVAGALAFNILRIPAHLLVTLLKRGRPTEGKTHLFADSLAAGLVAALMFAVQLVKPAP